MTSAGEQTEVSLLHEVRYDIHGQGEDDGWVLLRCDGAESLQVAQLQARRRLWDHNGCLLQGARCIHLTLCCNHLHVGRQRDIRMAHNNRVPKMAYIGFYSKRKCAHTPCMYCDPTFHHVRTLALASRVASASAAMALCNCCGSFTSLISTRSTLMPQLSVASSRLNWKRRKGEELTHLQLPCHRLMMHSRVTLTVRDEERRGAKQNPVPVPACCERCPRGRTRAQPGSSSPGHFSGWFEPADGWRNRH